MTFSRPVTKLAPLLIALLVLVSSSASFHGYLLQPSCQRVEDGCHPREAPCDDLEAGEAEHEGCETCDQLCCLAMSFALVIDRESSAALPAPPSRPPHARVAPRRNPVELFRPPLA